MQFDSSNLKNPFHGISYHSIVYSLKESKKMKHYWNCKVKKTISTERTHQSSKKCAAKRVFKRYETSLNCLDQMKIRTLNSESKVLCSFRQLRACKNPRIATKFLWKPLKICESGQWEYFLMSLQELKGRHFSKKFSALREFLEKN